jgi:hypothetical protein
MRVIGESRRKLYILAFGIWLFMYILNHFCYPFPGDDYVYSFIWEGHAIGVPLSEEAVRIQSFSDIFTSLYTHYMTWSGRLVAHFFLMFFLWIGKFWFNIINAAMVVLLCFCIQWIAHEGRIITEISTKKLALTFFCLWAFTFNFSGVMLWMAGSCNYLWTSVFLLLFLVPYVRHYFTNGAVSYKKWMGPAMAGLGFLAGNANENTIGWIGLTGLFYLYCSWKGKRLQTWMISGFIGLAIGFCLLMLAPGNFVRLSNDIGIKESAFNHMAIMWISLLFQNFLWFYLWKGYRWQRKLHTNEQNRSYFHLAAWFAGVSILFNLIMLLSPIMPARSTFPNLVFLVTAVMLISRLAEKQEVYVVQKSLERFAVLLGAAYFIWTAGFSLWRYHENYIWEKSVIAMAQSASQNQVLEVRESSGYEDSRYGALSGFHLGRSDFSDDENHWTNVSFARYYHIRGIRCVNSTE